MAQIYSMQRPGRPAWMLLATAALFLATLGVASLVVRSQRIRLEVDLDEPVSLPEGQLGVRLPKGWQRIARVDLPEGAVVGVIEPSREGQPGRRLYVFRGIPAQAGLSSHHGLLAVHLFCGQLGADVVTKEPPAGFGRVGPLTGFTLVAVTDPAGMEPGSTITCCLGRGAVGPRGESIGVAVETPLWPGTADQHLLDDVCRSIQTADITFASEPDRLMAQAHIRFKLPPNARLIEPARGFEDQLVLLGGAGAESWYLRLRRVPLIGRRTVNGLVEDLGLTTTQDVRLDREVKVFERGERPCAAVDLPIFQGQEPRLHVQAARIDDTTALLMLGRFEADAGGVLTALCRKIVSDAEVDPVGTRYEIADRLERGQSLIARFADGELDSRFQTLAGSRRAFVIGSPGFEWGASLWSCSRVERGGQPWWKITETYHSELTGLPKVVSQEMCEVRPDGREHHTRIQYTLGGTNALEYVETCDSDNLHVSRSLAIRSEARGSRDRRDSTVRLDDSFACAAVVEQIASLMSREQAGEPVILRTTAIFARDEVYTSLTPLGGVTYDGQEQATGVRGVMVASDFEVNSVILLFDEEGMPVGTDESSGEWSRRSTSRNGGV